MPAKEDEPIAYLYERQRTAASYPEWLAAAKQLDARLGFDKWKQVDRSQLYDYELVAARLRELREARIARDATKLLYLVRTTFTRNLGNTGDAALFKRSHSGTKELIENYIAECEAAISALLSWTTELDDTSLISTLVQTRKAFGRTALVLSGGATLGLLHSGVVYELLKNNLLPKIVSGSSAGSIFASLLCIHRDDEIDGLWRILDSPLDLFERTGHEETLMTRLKRFLKEGTWFDSMYLREMMQGLLGDMTFQEAYYRTGKILNVTVSTSSMYDAPRMLNYLTAPNVVIWSAVIASCSVPFVFASNTLYAKNPSSGELYSWSRATFIDGSVDNDLPLDRLAEMFNINHFIACQVNPHIAPFLHLSERFSDGTLRSMGRTFSSSSLGAGCSKFAAAAVGAAGGAATAAVSAGAAPAGAAPATVPVPAVSDAEAQAQRRTEDALAQDLYLGSRWWRLGKAFVLGELTHLLGIVDQVGVMPSATSKLSKLMSQEYIGDITIVPMIELHDFKNLLRNPTPATNHEAMQRGRAATWPKIAIIRNHMAIELALDKAIHVLRSRLVGRAGLVEAPLRTAKNHARRMSEEIETKHRRWQSSADLAAVGATAAAQSLTRNNSGGGRGSPQGSSQHLPLRPQPNGTVISNGFGHAATQEFSKSAQTSPNYLKRHSTIASTRGGWRTAIHTPNVSPTVSRENSVRDLPRLHRHNSVASHTVITGRQLNGGAPGDI